jgi:hypothetical protein
MKTNPTCLHRSSSSSRSKAVPRLRDRFSFAVLTALALIGLADRVAAQGTVPNRMTFQGFMEDASGVPLGQSAPANLPVDFRIYPSATGGTSSWAERQTVTFDKGRYSVLLGSGAEEGNEPHGNLSELVRTNSGAQLFVETTVTIDGVPATIKPRLRLVASPYALLATRALAADSADSAATLTGNLSVSQLSGSLSGANLVANSVTAQQIAANAVTSSELANDAVTTLKLANDAVTSGKLTDGSVIGPKIADGAITAAKIGANILLANQIPNLDASKITTGTFPASRLPSNVARRDTANTFTGNQTMNADLTVAGNLNLGTYKAATGSENLRIVRGLVKLDGTFTPYPYGLPAGSTYAFSVGRNATTGLFRITFQPAFAGEPAVTVCPIYDSTSGPNLDDAFAQIKGLSASYVDINFLKPNVGGGIRLPFSFIAVGPR